MKNHGLETDNDKMSVEMSTENTPNNKIGQLFHWDVLERSPLHMSTVHDKNSDIHLHNRCLCHEKF